LDSKNSQVKISIPRGEIHWIKKEPLDEGITIYETGSFSNHIPLKNFSKDEKDSILSILKEIWLYRKIRLVNF